MPKEQDILTQKRFSLRGLDVVLKRRLKNLKAVVMDVDGVLTDGGMYYGPSGEMMKKFNTKDGMAMELLQKAGIRIAWITGEQTDIVKKRAEKLNVSDIYTGVKDKLNSLNMFLSKYNISYDYVCYMGDEVNDIEAMKKVGVSVAVQDAVSEVKALADIVLTKKGGEGAVRELAELILGV
jgi:YrbI family 3-deoxy-D-manno-octulosonate 8-phosphate phosphatase